MSASPVLEVEGLSVRYRTRAGWVEAVSDLSLTVGEREILGIVGESGSGKSTVCGALLDLLAPGAEISATAVRLDGTDLPSPGSRAWSEVRGAKLGLIPQQPMSALAPTVAVGRQLDWYLGQGAVERHRDVLLGLGLDAVVERPDGLPQNFSGGQLQRLLIALTTIAHQPRLLFADEPTSTLDASVAATVVDLLAERRDSLDLSMVLISHDLAVVAQVCDRVAVMHHGQLVETAPVDELFSDPQHAYTRALIAALPPEIRRRAASGTATVGTPVTASPTVSPTVDAAPVDGPIAAPVPVPVLEVERLYHYYGGRGPKRRPPSAAVVRAIDEVDLHLRQGEILAVVGESGSGKTTLARAVVGQLSATAGLIRLDGAELTTSRTHEQRRLVQLVTQNPRAALNRRRPVGQALDQAQRVHDLGGDTAGRRQRAEAMVARMGLTPAHLDRRPLDLSGGEIARVVIARALLLEPRLLILDEPTAALDAQAKQAVVRLLRELRDELDLTVLVITHELPTAHELADRVAVMQAGRVVEQGPIGQVFAEPEHAYTKLLLDSVPPDPRG